MNFSAPSPRCGFARTCQRFHNVARKICFTKLNLIQKLYFGFRLGEHNRQSNAAKPPIANYNRDNRGGNSTFNPGRMDGDRREHDDRDRRDYGDGDR